MSKEEYHRKTEGLILSGKKGIFSPITMQTTVSCEVAVISVPKEFYLKRSIRTVNKSSNCSAVPLFAARKFFLKL